jgi:hypothetical protein
MSKTRRKQRAFAKRLARNTEWCRRVGFRLMRATELRQISIRQWFLRVSYKWLWGYTEWREKWEIWLAFGESLVAAYGTAVFFREMLAAIDFYSKHEEGAERPSLLPILVGAGEVTIFGLLLLSVVARLFFAIRERTLGQDFGALVKQEAKKRAKEKAIKKQEHDAHAQAAPVDESMFQSLSQFGSGEGYVGSMISAEAGTRKLILDAIASESATQFSRRTFGDVDPMWKKWEERYVGEWLEKFPATVWCLAPDDQRGSRASGYYSIVVPATEDSFRKVGFGHLSTALCAIDEPAVAYFHSGRTEPYGKPLYLVFYTVIHVPNGLLGHSPNQLKLLYGGVEHLAYLVKEFYPLVRDTETASVRVICEASNRSLEEVLKNFGFAPVAPDFDLELEHTHIRKSSAGFHLFEIAFDMGKPMIGDLRRASRFLELLREIGRRDKRQPVCVAEEEPDPEMSMTIRRSWPQ